MLIHHLNKTYKLQCILTYAIQDSEIEDICPTFIDLIQIMAAYVLAPNLYQLLQ